MSARDILAELPRLSDEERQQIAEALQKLETEKQSTISAEPHRQRTAGLHEGAWVIADDFDDPLPDEFWFGKDA